MKHYLFDFDGTLVDSMPTYVSVMLRILDENNIAYAPDIVQVITPLGYAGTAKYFVSLGVDRPEEEIVATMHAYAREAYATRIEAKQGVIDTLRSLRARGDALHVLTASPHEMLDPCLMRLGVYELFANVWSCNDFGTTKSDPEIYRMAADRIGAPVGEITFLDDNLLADQTAKSAGMRVIGVYDDSSRDDEDAIRTVADGYVCELSELLLL